MIAVLREDYGEEVQKRLEEACQAAKTRQASLTITCPISSFERAHPRPLEVDIGGNTTFKSIQAYIMTTCIYRDP
jgi:hypothetical protein